MSKKKIDKVEPGKKWVFDDSVTQAFDDMLQRSIPQYDIMRQSAFDLAKNFVQPKTTILDLGCSRGEAMAPFVQEFGACNTYMGIEISDPMLKVSRDRFKGSISNGLVSIEKMDLRDKYPNVISSVTLCVLTLQFTPIEHRLRIIHDIYSHLTPNGCLILVEKVLGNTHFINEALIKEYYKFKGDNGYSKDDIERKRLSLEGVLVPVTADWNEELLKKAGFKDVDCFWRWMNFAGWIAIK